ncbi:MAG: BREX system P-loop protein BrxC, partial [Thermodesulfobacteriota bacterium]|nr:BREX system P-loop protein BrxC [Thermodesulfobacteriota bacterium]
MMEIKDIFVRDIYRPINGVVKADQKNEAVVWQELDEYVVTKEILRHFYELIKAYLLTIDTPNNPAITDSMGVWVSGFFGSGKSHLIKILSYILGNIEARNPETGDLKHAVAFFESKITDPMFYADIKRAASYETDVVLFNIDSKADPSDGKAAILSVFWRVFNEMQGFSKDSLELAEMERYLSRQGKFEKFCKTFKEIHGSDWQEERDSYLLHQDEVVETLSKVFGKSRETAKAWFEQKINKTTITIETFATQVKEYLDNKGANHRIVFLVDEMGQFIGEDTNLMLNLQTITEDLGRLCGGRAWLIVTSQEAIDFVLENLKGSKANDFSKIQGRFKTKISLSGSNTDEVIQARLLEKTAQARLKLEELFSQKGDILKNQLSFTAESATLTSYTDTNSFVKNYPFVPYHFQILQKVFESIRKTGFAGHHLSQGERSMLDAFQNAAQEFSSKEIGALVPMYAFYPCIESFLDTSVKRSIDQAAENAVFDDFDIRLLKTLFLIRHVNILRPSIENIVTLCINEVDADRIALKRRIEESLVRLEQGHLIGSSGDLYYFLTNEEREVSQEIKSIEISSSEENRLISEIIFDEILKDKDKHRYSEYKKDYPFNRICDGIPHKTKTTHDLSVEIITPMNDDLAKDKASCIMYSTG